jgi:hydroxypyruvate reductase
MTFSSNKSTENHNHSSFVYKRKRMEFITSLYPLQTQDYQVQSISRILQASIEAADPFKVIGQNLSISKEQLRVGSKTFLLYPTSQIVTVAIGKASIAMAEAAQSILGGRIIKGVVVCKHQPDGLNYIGNMEVLQGSHPVPDDKSVKAAIRIEQVVRGLSPDDVVLLLISGGGSALVCRPADGITLEDIQAVTSALLKSGASINELNAVRKHLDLIKGGGLLKMASPAQVGGLVISDVVNSPLDVIASGPGVPDPTTFGEARTILEKYVGLAAIPESINRRFQLGCVGEVEETLKPFDPMAARVSHTIAASNRVSAEAAMKMAIEEGFDAEIITCELVGEARAAGEHLADLLLSRKTGDKPWVGIAGGETTVKVNGNGLGGRNLEVALGAVRKLGGHENCLLVTQATDGEDGPTDAAGAYVTGETMNEAIALGLEPEKYLHSNDAYRFFEKVGGLIVTGPSGTNVNDLNFIFKFRVDNYYLRD